MLTHFKIKNLDKAAERIKRAVKDKERIIIYGDSDCDGVCSVVILEEAIKSLGGKVSAVAFPDREKDGYGMNLKALDFLKDLAPALFVTLDLGIANIKEVKVANEMGFEVIIIDHHQILDQMPDAKIIVDPQQKDDEYPFKDLCNAGITFKLAKEILGNNLSEKMENSLLEVTALATISDMVPQVQENKTFIEKGIKSLAETFRPGLKAFLDILGRGYVASGDYMKIISSINAAESMDFKNEAYDLLTNSSEEQCRDTAEKLLGKVILKQQRVNEIIKEVEKRITKKPNKNIIFEGDAAWRLVLAGPVASVIAGKYQKPTFIYRKMDEESAGSVRSPEEGQNSVEAMKSCSDLLMTYGGHPKASGFRLKNENLEKFKACLVEHFNKQN